jgi:AraC-like DNA-binding protein
VREGEVLSAFQKIPDHDPQFPFFLYYKGMPLTGKRGVPARERSGYHFHHWHEIVFIHRGVEGTFFINQNFYDISQNDIFIIPGGIIHRSAPGQYLPDYSSVVLFDPSLIHDITLGESFGYLEAFHHSEKEKNYRIILQAQQGGVVDQFLTGMQQELASMTSGYRFRVLNLLHLLLMELLQVRKQEASKPAAKESKSHIWMKDILAYIDDRLHEDLSLPELAEQALVSPAHFSRVFKKLTGFQVTEYLLAKRILQAKKLLTQDGSSVSLIAEQCGFQSLSHFHRMFRRHIGLTPGQYRSRMRE